MSFIIEGDRYTFQINCHISRNRESQESTLEVIATASRGEDLLCSVVTNINEISSAMYMDFSENPYLEDSTWILPGWQAIVFSRRLIMALWDSESLEKIEKGLNRDRAEGEWGRVEGQI